VAVLIIDKTIRTRRKTGMDANTSNSGPDGQVQVRHNQPVRSYEAVVDGVVVGTLIYETAGGRRSLTHTFVDPSHRGRGIAAALARYALDDAKADGVRARAVCGYVAAYVGRHPEYQDTVDQA
jgi:predicted GNAT family acetyltransferase